MSEKMKVSALVMTASKVERVEVDHHLGIEIEYAGMFFKLAVDNSAALVLRATAAERERIEADKDMVELFEMNLPLKMREDYRKIRALIDAQEKEIERMNYHVESVITMFTKDVDALTAENERLKYQAENGVSGRQAYKAELLKANSTIKSLLDGYEKIIATNAPYPTDMPAVACLKHCVQIARDLLAEVKS